MSSRGYALADTVDGVPARRSLAPSSVEELAQLFAEEFAEDEAVVLRGRGTKLEWGRPPSRLDTIVELAGLPHEIEHAAGDLVVRVSTAVGLAELNTALALAGQRLVIDEVVAGSSVGGVLATGLSGPLRYGFGAVRDLLLGVTVVRADGTVARSGGRVVKNVAGYDLGKLYTGSYGTLGAITEATFRLHPISAATRYLRFSPSLDGLATLQRALVSSPSAPSAIELAADGSGALTLTVLLEGSARGVPARAAQLRASLGDAEEMLTAPPGFGVLPGETTLKLTFDPGASGDILRALVGELSSIDGLIARGSVALGSLYLGGDGLTAESLGPLLARVRALAGSYGGSAIVLRAPRAVREDLDVWGPVAALSLMDAVKARFDPHRRLAPGRFVGGI